MTLALLIEQVITGEASGIASSGSYQVNVTQLARNGIITFTDRFNEESSIIASNIDDNSSEADRTVSIVVGSGTNSQTTSIALTSTTTANQFVAEFNQKSTTARANLINVGTVDSPQYAVSITSSETGTSKGQLSVSVGGELNSKNRLNNTSITQAQNSIFSIVGVGNNISRSSNNVGDVIPGLSLNLLTEGSSTLSVGIGSQETLAKVRGFVESYNEIITFFNENNSVERNEDGEEVENVFGSLAQVSTDDNAVEALRSGISSTNFLNGTRVKILADIGITTARDGTLEFAEDKFSEALAAEPSSVESLLSDFADKNTFTGQTISNFTRFGGLFDITINSQQTRITSLGESITEAEAFIARQEQNLRARFSRLESLIGGLQSQQNALSGVLASLGR
jgi:flagellar hook-associated protein 2